MIDASLPVPSESTRLISLDVYRGFVMLLMASEGLGIVQYVYQSNTSSAFWRLLAHHVEHVEWKGCSLWDLIQPSFTFIVGVALPFSLAKRRASGQSFGRLTSHAIARSLILILLGIFLRSINERETKFTFEDTLTQIGLGYTFLFMLAWTRPRTHIATVALILLGYWLAFALYPLPPAGFDYAAVGVPETWRRVHGLHGFAAHWNKNANFAAAFDQRFLNWFPREHPFVFNGGGYLTLSFIPTLATMILGLLVGQLFRFQAVTPMRKILVLLAAGCTGLILGLLLDRMGICPIVKRIWTPAWTLYSAGWACLLLAVFYALVDCAGWRRAALPLLVVGMNSIAMYCMADSPIRGFISSSFRTHLGRNFFHLIGSSYEPIVESAAVLLVLWLICVWFYRRKIFLRI